ncbi:MAG: DUF2269 family protein [Proteobacteria bacterium]|nr:DUF2269 family protein [Pseudomonadota bacterium]
MDQFNGGGSLPERYKLLFRVWFVLGWPAFLGLVAIFCLMVIKPTW